MERKKGKMGEGRTEGTGKVDGRKEGEWKRRKLGREILVGMKGYETNPVMQFTNAIADVFRRRSGGGDAVARDHARHPERRRTGLAADGAGGPRLAVIAG